MSTQQHSFIDDDVPMTPPTDSIAADLEEQYEWLLKRFTNAEWTVTELRVEENSHADCSASALEAALSHESGSVIQVVPFDPQEHHHDAPIYRANRVRLRDNIDDRNCYVTLSNEVGEWEEADYPTDQFVGQQNHPYPNAEDRVSYHDQSTVHVEDEAVFDQGENKVRSYAMTTLKDTLVAVFGAAQSITEAEDQQADLQSYF